jgi:acetyltransferase-like isoleucine patch superfamily enzyme
MKKIIILFSLLFYSAYNHAQFKTTYNQSGDPLSEITDASSMKQGDWKYYDYEAKVIRIDTYSDNILIDRKCFKNNIEIQNSNLINYRTINVVINENLRPYSGEAIINENGVIISFSVYYNQNINFDKKKINQLETFIKKIAKDNKKTILIF